MNNKTSMIKKSQKIISGLKVIRFTLHENLFQTMATSQYYGSLFYGLLVWYFSLLKNYQQKMDVLQFKLLRVAVRDCQKVFPRDLIDTLGQARPNVFAKYTLGPTIINPINRVLPLHLSSMISKNIYIN